MAKPPLDAARAERLRALLEHPGWPDLRETAKESAEKKMQTTVKQLLVALPGTQVDQGRLDYDRGWWAGIDWILSEPDRAAKALSKLDQQAEEGDTE